MLVARDLVEIGGEHASQHIKQSYVQRLPGKLVPLSQRFQFLHRLRAEFIAYSAHRGGSPSRLT
ncbi:MAG TPA: hypothetical protein VIH18_04715, partial [Candidatus Binatia bacterium]